MYGQVQMLSFPHTLFSILNQVCRLPSGPTEPSIVWAVQISSGLRTNLWSPLLTQQEIQSTSPAGQGLQCQQANTHNVIETLSHRVLGFTYTPTTPQLGVTILLVKQKQDSEKVSNRMKIMWLLVAWLSLDSCLCPLGHSGTPWLWCRTWSHAPSRLSQGGAVSCFCLVSQSHRRFSVSIRAHINRQT
jgi:hypothetical protein